MTVGELRRLFVDLSIPDSAHIHVLPVNNKRTPIDNWFIEKSPTNNEYELVFLISSTDKTKEIKPPPFKPY